MSVHTQPKVARRSVWEAIFPWLQRRPNHVATAEATEVPSTPNELANDGWVAPPASDRRPEEHATRQRLSYYAAEVFMAQECSIAPKTKSNSLAADMAQVNRFLAQDRVTADTPNGPEAINALVATEPKIDTKHLTDWLSMQPNKELLPAYQLDQETKQRLQFARYLIKRGTYNEGFADAETPPQYRSLEDYTDDDFAPPDKLE